MTKPTLVSILASLVVIAAAGAAEPVAVDFTIKTDWRGEIIKLPPRFAPEMKTVGVEEIRFAPGMFKADQPDFFSYLFVITSTTGQSYDAAFLHSELLAYYKGLAKAVSKGAIDPSNFSLKLSPAKTPPAGIKASYGGTLDWVEPFSTRKPQVLNFDIQISEHDGREYLFVCVSPQKTEHAIWTALRQVRTSFAVNPAADK